MAEIPDGYVIIANVSEPILQSENVHVDVSIVEKELVMCRNCKYYGHEPYGDVMMCYRGLGWTAPDDYCSKGERGL